MERHLQELLAVSIKNLYGVEIETITLDTPPKKNLGDFAFGCFEMARHAKKSPQIIAEELKNTLLENDTGIISDIKIAGPYINIFINRTGEALYNLYLAFDAESIKNTGKNKTVIIDYIGANVGKPLHIGHMCTPTQGESMVSAYKKAGYEVISDSHIGDWGIIFGKLIVAYKKYGEESQLKENAVDYLLELYVKITSDSENDETLDEQFRETFKKLSQGDAESVKLWKMFTAESIDAMNQILARLHVKPDFNIGESFYEGIGLPKIENYPDLSESMHEVVDELVTMGIATKNDDNSIGVEFPGESAIPSCILQKRNGTHGYLASDLACIKYRMKNWSPDYIRYFVDIRQKLHLEQVFDISTRAGWLKREGQTDTSLYHAGNGFISGKDGAFSTRKGNIIRLGEVLNEAEKRARDLILEKRQDLSDKKLGELSRIVGIGAIKYGYLKKKRTTDVVFDWDEFMTFEGNSGPYIQYAYVRATKILEKSEKREHAIKKEKVGKYTKQIVLEKSENLLKKIGEFSEKDGILITSIEKDMPHYIAQYSYDLTKIFSDFYDKVHVLDEPNLDMKSLLLEIVKLYISTIRECFDILGIELPSEM